MQRTGLGQGRDGPDRAGDGSDRGGLDRTGPGRVDDEALRLCSRLSPNDCLALLEQLDVIIMDGILADTVEDNIAINKEDLYICN